MILGITGTDGAGKGTAVDYLVHERGYTHYSARTLFATELERRRIEPSRSNLRLIANELRGTYGNDYVISHYLEEIEKEHTNCAAIESIRTLAEVKALKEAGGILLAIDANQKVRYQRVQERRSSTDRVSFDAFVAHEALEGNDPDPHGMQKKKVVAMADHCILNDGTLDELHKNIAYIMQLIENTQK